MESLSQPKDRPGQGAPVRKIRSLSAQSSAHLANEDNSDNEWIEMEDVKGRWKLKRQKYGESYIM